MSVPRARRSLLAAIAIGGLGACGGGGGAPHDAGADVSIDAPPDAPGTCAATDSFLSGEILDWDSDLAANFCGVFRASFVVRGRSGSADLSATNGRFGLCVPQQAQTLVDVTPPSAPTGCTGYSGTYRLSAVVIASGAVVSARGFYDARMMLEARVISMFMQIGQPLATDHGQLFVHVLGTPRSVSISAGHDATQLFNGETWVAAGPADASADVFFPNVDLTAGAVSVTMTGTTTGTGNYTLEPGKLTYLTVIAN